MSKGIQAASAARGEEASAPLHRIIIVVIFAATAVAAIVGCWVLGRGAPNVLRGLAPRSPWRVEFASRNLVMFSLYARSVPGAPFPPCDLVGVHSAME